MPQRSTTKLPARHNPEIDPVGAPLPRHGSQEHPQDPAPTGAETVIPVLISIGVFLVLAHLGWAYGQHRSGTARMPGMRLFDMGAEANLPAWFSTALFLGCAALFLQVASAHRRMQQADHRSWTLLSLLFIFLSLDEAAMIHETAQVALRIGVDRSGTGFSLLSAVFPLLVIGTGAVIAVRILRALPRRTALLFLTAAGVFVCGALLFDFAGELYRNHGDRSILYTAALDATEESAEIAGLIILVHALCDYMKRHLGISPLGLGS